LRDSAKLEAKQLTIDLAPIDFRNVMIETLRPFQQQLDEKQQKIVLNVPEGLPLIKGDQNRLIQVMTNLVSNAHKYSQPESAITVTAFVDKQRVSMEHQIIPALHVAVADTGIGMSEEDLARIFHERYFRSDNPLAREQPGTGLGMMITEGIIEGHHGEIWVESKLGSGTTFHFTIPLAAQTEPQTAAQPEPASD
jgi:two-component system phosphate regulon sensor histidine kinase PhoR